VQSTAGAAGEARSIEEDARAVDDARLRARLVREDAPERASAWCSKRRLERGRQRADVAGFLFVAEFRATEQQPCPSCSAGSSRMPRHPRPQMQVQFDVRNDRSKRQTVSPSWISSIS